MEYKIGNVIKSLRIKKGLTQKNLAKDICSVKQLSRVESNQSLPTILLIKEFSYKLGEDLGEYFLFLDQEKPIEAKLLIDKLENYILRCDFAKAYELSTKYKQTHDLKPSVFRQYLDWFHGYTSLLLPYADPMDITYFYDLLRENYQFSSLIELLDRFLKPIDFRILSAIIVIHLRNRELEVAQILLEKAIESYEKHYINITDSCYLRFLYNLSRIHLLDDDYEKSLQYSTKGMEYCMTHNSLSFLDDFTIMKGKALFHLGRKEEAKSLLNFYIYSAQFYSKHLRKNIIIDNIRNDFDLT